MNFVFVLVGPPGFVNPSFTFVREGLYGPPVVPRRSLLVETVPSTTRLLLKRNISSREPIKNPCHKLISSCRVTTAVSVHWHLVDVVHTVRP